MLVSINILTWNAQKYIRKCLESALNQTYPKVEINILDNGSQDKTVKIIKDEYLPKFPQIVFIENKTNCGFAAGHNQLINISRGDLILPLNQDLILDKNYIKNSVELFNDKSVGAMQGKLYRYDFDRNEAEKIDNKKIIDTTGLIILKSRRVINRGQGEKDIGQFNKIEEVFGADGAAPIYRKQALESIKIPEQPNSKSKIENSKFEFFDSSFFAYLEDVDLSWRLRLYGWKIIYNPKAIGYHGRGAKDVQSIYNLRELIKGRKMIGAFAKEISWRNRRLMQVKNEFLVIFLKHLPWWLLKEILGVGYLLLFERSTLKAIPDFFKMLPTVRQKRKIIMKNIKVSARDIEKWFK